MMTSFAEILIWKVIKIHAMLYISLLLKIITIENYGAIYTDDKCIQI